MKKNITLLLLSMAAATGAIAQPVVTSSLTSVPVGTIDTAYGASPTVMPGPGGAGINWDMSTVPTIYAAKLTVVAPASTPYAATFATANFCTKIEGSSTNYNYSKQSSTGLENLSETYAGAGVGTDFSPNPRLNVPFPFSYTNTKTDTFQTTTTGPDTVRLTYDGYGTLKSPFYSYSNVFRIKEEFATYTAYSWYTVSPFALVMHYSSKSNNYVIVTTRPVATTGVPDLSATTQAVISPNPTSGNAVLRAYIAGSFSNAILSITDITGRVAKQIPVTSSETIIQTNGLTPGMYFYTLHNTGVVVANGKLLINK